MINQVAQQAGNEEVKLKRTNSVGDVTQASPRWSRLKRRSQSTTEVRSWPPARREVTVEKKQKRGDIGDLGRLPVKPMIQIAKELDIKSFGRLMCTSYGLMSFLNREGTQMGTSHIMVLWYLNFNEYLYSENEILYCLENIRIKDVSQAHKKLSPLSQLTNGEIRRQAINMLFRDTLWKYIAIYENFGVEKHTNFTGVFRYMPREVMLIIAEGLSVREYGRLMRVCGGFSEFGITTGSALTRIYLSVKWFLSFYPGYACPDQIDYLLNRIPLGQMLHEVRIIMKRDDVNEREACKQVIVKSLVEVFRGLTDEQVRTIVTGKRKLNEVEGLDRLEIAALMRGESVENYPYTYHQKKASELYGWELKQLKGLEEMRLEDFATIHRKGWPIEFAWKLTEDHIGPHISQDDMLAAEGYPFGAFCIGHHNFPWNPEDAQELSFYQIYIRYRFGLDTKDVSDYSDDQLYAKYYLEFSSEELMGTEGLNYMHFAYIAKKKRLMVTQGMEGEILKAHYSELIEEMQEYKDLSPEQYRYMENYGLKRSAVENMSYEAMRHMRVESEIFRMFPEVFFRF